VPERPVSLILAAKNEGENLSDMLDCALSNSGPRLCEIIVVDDGSTDGCGDRVRASYGGRPQVTLITSQGLGVARARNLGAERAKGEFLAFMDAHCYLPKGWLDGLLSAFDDPDVGMVGPAIASLCEVDGARGYGAIWGEGSLQMQWLPCKGNTPYEVPLHPGGCQLVRRRDFAALGGYDDGMSRWGSEGEELSIRYWLMGYRVLVQPQVVVHHLFRKRHPYRVESPRVYHNQLRMALLHFNDQRLLGTLAGFAGLPEFERILLWLLEGNVMLKRRQLHSRRRRDDAWFFARFPNPQYLPVESKPAGSQHLLPNTAYRRVCG
jgi:glycosyltransferase involved in cell wall biosynthesis